MSTARILIVEDEGLTAMELQRKLKILGYDVPTFAFSGKEAILKAEKLKPDLILMDIVLKGKIDGISAAEEIIKHQDVPLIYLTAHSDEETKKRAKKTQPFAYILKPFDQSVLQKSIDEAINHHKKHKKINDSTLFVNETIKKQDGAVIVTDSEGIIRFMNASAANLTGYAVDKAMDKKIDDIFKLKKIDKNNNEFINPVFKLLKNSCDEIKGEASLENSSGLQYSIKYTVAPLKSSEGKLNGVTIIFNQTLQNHEKAMINEVCSKFTHETGIFNAEGIILCANTSFLNFFSVKSIDELKWLNLFNDLGFNDQLKQDLNDSNNIKYEFKINPAQINLNKTEFPDKSLYLELTISSYDGEGKIDSDNNYILHLKDVTDLKNLENSLEFKPLDDGDKNTKSKYGLISNSSVDVFLALDSQLKCMHWSSKACDTTGILSEDAVGKSVYELIPFLMDSEAGKLFLKNLQSTGILDKQIETIENENTELKFKLNELKDELNNVQKSEKEHNDSFRKNERQYKELLEENKALREDKSRLKKLNNQVQREYLELEKEYKEELEFHKNRISQLKRVKKIP